MYGEAVKMDRVNDSDPWSNELVNLKKPIELADVDWKRTDRHVWGQNGEEQVGPEWWHTGMMWNVVVNKGYFTRTEVEQLVRKIPHGDRWYTEGTSMKKAKTELERELEKRRGSE